MAQIEPSTMERVDALIARDQSAIACPYPIFSDLRAAGGVVFSEALGAWLVTRYDDVRAILRDTERFSSLFPTGPQTGGESLMKGIMELMQDPEMASVLGSVSMTRGRAAVLLNADPPDHRRQRKLVNPAFRPDRIRGLEPLIRATATSLMADVVERLKRDGEVDIVATFAVGLPMTIIAHALGVPDHDLVTFKRWSDDLVMPVGNHDPSVEQVRGFVLSTKAFNEYFLARIAERKVQPTDDILSDIANAVIDGEELSDDEQLGMLTQFLVAGNETTTKLITNIIRHLADTPSSQERIDADRSLVEPLVEEMLRIEAPVGGLFRRTKVDVEINGTPIPAGEHLWLLFASANRDECRFAEPDVVDVDRPNVKEHLAFGNGEHFCPGAGLARAEARIATEVVLDRLKNLRLASHNEFRYGDSFVLRGLESLVVTADPV
ncbi:MAG: cytochrome P450 [Ilumatobacteraceae bacterium]